MRQLGLPLEDCIAVDADGARELLRRRVGAALREHVRRQRGRVAADDILLDQRDRSGR